MDNVLLLCRVEGERVEDVNVVRVAPRGREGYACAYKPWGVEVKDDLHPALRDPLVGQAWLVRVITLVETKAHVRGERRSNGRRDELVVDRHGKSNGGNAYLAILFLAVARGREVKYEVIVSRVAYLTSGTANRRDSVFRVKTT